MLCFFSKWRQVKGKRVEKSVLAVLNQWDESVWIFLPWIWAGLRPATVLSCLYRSDLSAANSSKPPLSLAKQTFPGLIAFPGLFVGFANIIYVVTAHSAPNALLLTQLHSRVAVVVFVFLNAILWLFLTLLSCRFEWFSNSIAFRNTEIPVRNTPPVMRC